MLVITPTINKRTHIYIHEHIFSPFSALEIVTEEPSNNEFL